MSPLLDLPKALLTALAGGGMLMLATAAWAESAWVAHQGMQIRVGSDGDVVCQTQDFQRCALTLGGASGLFLSGLVDPSNLGDHELRCTNKKAHGGKTGYEQVGHWCNEALAVLTDDWLPLQDMVLSRTPLGDPMCFSVNGADCGTPREFEMTPPARRKLLSCGAVHEKLYGTTGYERPDHWCSELPSPFTLAITSDPQYPWRNEEAVPSSGNAKTDSDGSIGSTYDSIRRFNGRTSMLRGTIVNGDVTAFGHAAEWDYMRSALGRLKTPVFLGLGNHDIENNVDDCWENNCFLNSLQALQEFLPPGARMDVATDEYYEHFSMVRHRRGSFAWTMDINGVQFVFLNNGANYTARTSNLVSAKAITERVTLTSALPWLEKELRAARGAGKAIVLVVHRETMDSADGRFTRWQFMNLVKRYQVGAIFMGHIHEHAGGGKSWWGDHAEFYSGSASTRTYLLVDFDVRFPDQPARMTVRLSRDGDIDNAEFLGRYDLPTMQAEPERVLPPQPRQIRLVNNGGYVARFFVKYTDEISGTRSLTSGRVGLGDTWTATVPAGVETGVNVRAEVLTGLVWRPWDTVLDHKVREDEGCFKFWGSTLNPSWGRC